MAKSTGFPCTWPKWRLATPNSWLLWSTPHLLRQHPWSRETWADSDDPEGYIKKKMIEVAEETVILRIPMNKAKKMAASEVDGLMDNLTGLASAVPGAMPTKSVRSRPALVSGTPKFLDEQAAADLSFQGNVADEEYAAMRPRLGLAVGLGIAGALAIAVAWGLLGAYADRSSWVVGIAGGMGIGWLMVKGAGKTNRGIQVTIVVLSIAAVVVGEVFAAVFVINKEFGVFDVGLAFDLYFANLDELGGQMFFAVAGGAIGGYYGAKLASKPAIVPVIEMAPA